MSHPPLFGTTKTNGQRYVTSSKLVFFILLNNPTLFLFLPLIFPFSFFSVKQANKLFYFKTFNAIIHTNNNSFCNVALIQCLSKSGYLVLESCWYWALFSMNGLCWNSQHNSNMLLPTGQPQACYVGMSLGFNRCSLFKKINFNFFFFLQGSIILPKDTFSHFKRRVTWTNKVHSFEKNK